MENKGANYLVTVTEFCKNYCGGSYTEYYYFNGKDAAVNYAKMRAKKCGCGEFKNASVSASFWVQATGNGYWVDVQEITLMD